MLQAASDRVRAIVDGSFGPSVIVSADRPLVETELESLWRAGADVVEYRVDRFDRPLESEWPRRSEGGDLLTLLTIRSVEEGGAWSGSEAERSALFQTLAARVDFVDVELHSEIFEDVVEAAHDGGAQVISSWHRFDRPFVPAELDDAVRKADASGSDLLKIACHAGAAADLVMLSRWLIDHASRPIILVLMSSMGPASRVLFPLLGSRLTYAAAHFSKVVSGQMSLEDTFYLLRRFSPVYNERKIIELALMDDA